MKYLGIDIGAASCRIALLDADNKIIERKEKRHHGKAGQTLLKMIEELCLKFPGISNEAIRLAVCGSMKNVSGLAKEYHAGETLALSVAMKTLHPKAGMIWWLILIEMFVFALIPATAVGWIVTIMW